VVPQIALAAMLIEGVFERHPRLVVMVQELGISWLPHFLETIDSVTVGPYGAQFGMGAGDYALPLRPSEYMRRQVRVTPLASPDLRPRPAGAPRLLERLPAPGGPQRRGRALRGAARRRRQRGARALLRGLDRRAPRPLTG